MTGKYIAQEIMISRESGFKASNLVIHSDEISLKIDGVDVQINFIADVDRDDMDWEIGQYEDEYHAVYSEIELDTELDIDVDSTLIQIILDTCSWVVADKLKVSF